MDERAIEAAADHPAAKIVHQIFLTLLVYSEADYRKLPRRDRYVWDISWFETELTNGGVDQYFMNSTGDHAAECLEALQTIGATKGHALLKHACDFFPDGRPSPYREVRQQQLRTFAGAQLVDDLSEAIWEDEIEVDLYQRLLDYYHAADPKGP